MSTKVSSVDGSAVATLAATVVLHLVLDKLFRGFDAQISRHQVGLHGIWWDLARQHRRQVLLRVA